MRLGRLSSPTSRFPCVRFVHSFVPARADTEEPRKSNRHVVQASTVSMVRPLWTPTGGERRGCSATHRRRLSPGTQTCSKMTLALLHMPLFRGECLKYRHRQIPVSDKNEKHCNSGLFLYSSMRSRWNWNPPKNVDRCRPQQRLPCVNGAQKSRLSAPEAVQIRACQHVLGHPDPPRRRSLPPVQVSACGMR